MTYVNRCLGCMREKGEKNPCPLCGFDENVKEINGSNLPPRYLLHGRYTVGKMLGQGGFGVTYIGWDMTLDLIVAIKEYMPNAIAARTAGGATVSCRNSRDEEDYIEGLNKFLSEARTLASFSNAGIVQVRDFFEENSTAYMVMEYIDGIDFKEYIDKSGGRVSWEEALHIVSVIAGVLGEVHAKGMLHRDISPDNIFIKVGNERQSLEVKLIDFGAARATAGNQNKSLSIILKHGYAPIEQYNTRGQGPWTDVYALAATLYRSVTGILPPNAIERLDSDTLQAPSALGIDIPREMEAALMRALSVKPGDRYQSMEEFRAALNGRRLTSAQSTAWVPHSHEEAAQTVAYVPPTTGRKQSVSDPKKKNTGLLAACVIIALALAGGGFFLMSGVMDSDPSTLYVRGKESLAQGRKAEGLELLKKAAEKGYTEAEYEIARSYYNGAAGEQNLPKAAGLLIPLSDKGHLGARYLLGKMYTVGSGVPKNVKSGMEMLEQASEGGRAEASYELGRIYEEGIATAKDIRKAIDLYAKAGIYEDAADRRAELVARAEAEEKRRREMAEQKRLAAEAEKAREEERRRAAEERKRLNAEAAKAKEEERRRQAREQAKQAAAKQAGGSAQAAAKQTPAPVNQSAAAAKGASLKEKANAIRAAMAQKSAAEQARLNKEAAEMSKSKGISVNDALAVVLGILLK